jgi:hypothetical protein
MATEIPKAPVVPINKPEPGVGGYQALNPRSEVLPAGWNGFNSRPLPSAILVEHDVAFTMRDGKKLYAGVYRPPNSDLKQVPAILCWGPFGKRFNGLTSLRLMTPWNLGIPDGTLSGLEEFDAPSEPSILSYKSESSDSLLFTHTFPHKAQLIGIPKAVLYMSCPDHNDMDVYVQNKLDKSGNHILNLNIPWKGIPIQSFDEFTPEAVNRGGAAQGPSRDLARVTSRF